MKYSQLGKTGIRVSKLGFGCMSLRQPGSAAELLLQAAAALGVNYFDTADIYGHGDNERLLGKALKSVRKDILLATKVGNRYNADNTTLSWVPSKKYIMESVEGSLHRLQTDYIDLYQLHGGTIEDPLEEILETFQTLQAQGKIRQFGISSIRPNVIRAYLESSTLASVMMQYSLLDRRPEEQCLPLLLDHGVSAIVRGAVAQGLLIDKPARPYLGHSMQEVENLQQLIGDIASRNSSELSIQFALAAKPVATVVLGMSTPAQLETAIKAVSAPDLSPQEMETLQAAAPPLLYDQHR